MPTVSLYNLSLGPHSLPEKYTTAKIGPFTVRLVPEYKERVHLLPRAAQKTTSFDFTEQGLTKKVSYEDERPGGWLVTAEAEFEPGSATSVLCRGTNDDDGVWDLCELLTFLTGRRVAVEEQLSRYDPRMCRSPACIGIETLHAARLAWNNRTRLVDDGVVNAILLHNEATTLDLLQAAGALYCAAVNVLFDAEPAPPDVDIIAPVKNVLIATIGAAVQSMPSLTEDQRQVANALISAALAKGVSPAVERLTSMLTGYGVLIQPVHKTTAGRVKLLNVVRNAVAHCGSMPLLKGFSPEVSDAYTLAILFVVMPGIIQLVVGNKLGFTASGLGSLSQHPDSLRAFFERGVSGDWKLEEQTFEQYYYEEAS